MRQDIETPPTPRSTDDEEDEDEEDEEDEEGKDEVEEEPHGAGWWVNGCQGCLEPAEIPCCSLY